MTSREGSLPPRKPLALVKMRWWVFFAVLLAPPILTFLSAYSHRGFKGEPDTPAVCLVSGVVAGIVCGTMLAVRLSSSYAGRIFLGIVFSCILTVVCIFLGFGGCTVGGYSLQI